MTHASVVTVRPWLEADIPTVWTLMRDLAVFERYIDDFAVTEAALLEQGFRLERPNLYVLVAEVDTRIVGILVYYFLPFTMRATPALFIKELFVSDTARGYGVGKALIRRVALEAHQHGCEGIQWTVADWNEPAQRFYESLGARGNPVWIPYGFDRAAIDRLVAQP